MKKTLRKNMKALREKINMEEKSRKLSLLLKQSEEYKNAKNIMIFYPKEHEVNLLELLNDSKKTFYLPKIDGQNLCCCKYSLNETLCDSCFSTKEPLTPPTDKSSIDLIIVPALCCDENNFRLGYGGGFYDRFLQDYTGTTIVCIPKELIVKSVYPEEHDMPVDIVITD